MLSLAALKKSRVRVVPLKLQRAGGPNKKKVFLLLFLQKKKIPSSFVAKLEAIPQ